MKFLECLKEEFNLTPWDLVIKTLENTYANYHGKTHLEWKGEASYGITASIKMEACSCGANLDRKGEATIEWFTSSGHYVKIEMEMDWEGNWRTTKVSIGNDESEYFYPGIIGIAKDLGISVEKGS